jgi:hypothetical protein
MRIRQTTIRTDEIDDVILVASDDAITRISFPAHWTNPDWSGRRSAPIRARSWSAAIARPGCSQDARCDFAA